jgi:hypothetical protein
VDAVDSDDLTQAPPSDGAVHRLMSPVVGAYEQGAVEDTLSDEFVTLKGAKLGTVGQELLANTAPIDIRRHSRYRSNMSTHHTLNQGYAGTRDSIRCSAVGGSEHL